MHIDTNSLEFKMLILSNITKYLIELKLLKELKMKYNELKKKICEELSDYYKYNTILDKEINDFNFEKFIHYSRPIDVIGDPLIKFLKEYIYLKKDVILIKGIKKQLVSFHNKISLSNEKNLILIKALQNYIKVENRIIKLNLNIPLNKLIIDLLFIVKFNTTTDKIEHLKNKLRYLCNIELIPDIDNKILKQVLHSVAATIPELLTPFVPGAPVGFNVPGVLPPLPRALGFPGVSGLPLLPRALGLPGVSGSPLLPRALELPGVSGSPLLPGVSGSPLLSGVSGLPLLQGVSGMEQEGRLEIPRLPVIMGGNINILQKLYYALIFYISKVDKKISLPVTREIIPTHMITPSKLTQKQKVRNTFVKFSDGFIQNLTQKLDQSFNFYDKQIIDHKYISKFNGNILKVDGEYYLFYRFMCTGYKIKPNHPESLSHPWKMWFADQYEGELRQKYYENVILPYNINRRISKFNISLKIDTTAVAKIKIEENGEINVIKDNKYFFYYDNINYYPLIDTRASLINNNIYLTFNIWKHKWSLEKEPKFEKWGECQDRDKQLKSIKPPVSWVAMIACGTIPKQIDINTTLNKIKKCQSEEKGFGPGLCTVYDAKFGGKNWTIFNFNGKRYILYWLYKEFTVLDYDKCLKIQCPIIKFSNKPVIGLTYILNEFDGNMMSGLGSSAIQFNFNEYIGTGHIKIKYMLCTHPLFKKFYNTYIKNKRAEKFLHNTTNPKLNQIYFTFLYTFDPTTFKILKLSNPFLVLEQGKQLDYTIQFASGFNKIGNNYIMTYGEGDVFLKTATFTKDQLDKMLMPEENYKEEFDFYIYEMPAKFSPPIEIEDPKFIPKINKVFEKAQKETFELQELISTNTIKQINCNQKDFGLKITISITGGLTKSRLFVIDQNNVRIILKAYMYKDELSFNKPTNNFNMELSFLKKARKNKITENLTPHLAKQIGDIFICTKDILKDMLKEEDILLIKDTIDSYYNKIKLTYLSYERIGDLCYALRNNIILNSNIFFNVIFQIIFTCATLYVNMNFIHADLHIRNVMFDFDQNYKEDINLYYEYKIVSSNLNKSFYVPVTKYIPKLIDFDKSSYGTLINDDRKLDRIDAVPNGRFRHTIQLLNNIRFKKECDIYKFDKVKEWMDRICVAAGWNINKNDWDIGKGISNDTMSIRNIFNDNVFAKLLIPPGNGNIIKTYTLTISDPNKLN